MALSPEERRRIYEEEKARLEAAERLEREKRTPEYETSTGLAPNVQGLLCYLGWWITGLIFFFVEKKNNWARFHAAQSIVFFGAVTVVSIILGSIPFVGPFFSTVITIIGAIFWIVLMIKAYQGEHYMIPVAGEVAEKMVGPIGPPPDYQRPPAPPAPPSPPTPPSAAAEAPSYRPEDLSRHERRAERRYYRERREARVAGSAVAIAWFIVLLVFFNFFSQYAAYYTGQTVNGVTTLTRHPFFTGDISRWLPILNVTLAVAIIGYFFMMFIDNRYVRRSMRIVMDALGLATVVTLLVVHPFDFTIIPDSTASWVTQVSVTIVLALIAVGFGIGLIVRIISLLIDAARGLAGPREID